MTSPIFHPITQNFNYSLVRLKRDNIGFSATQTNIRLPELGKLIMKKLVPNATDYYGCMDLILKYKDNDLYSVLSSFEDALRKKQGSKIMHETKELETITENVWDDVKKMGPQIRGIKTGLSFAFGLAGALGTSSVQALSSDPNLVPLAGLGGLLAGLGFNTWETNFNPEKRISERIGKWFKPDYLVNIFDFSKKYDIK